MIACQNCRTENQDDAALCVSCGESPTLSPKTLSASVPRDPAATATGFTYPLAEGEIKLAAAGTRIANRYELVALLGRGGMGLVYKARDLVLNEDTAIKLLQPQLVREVGDLERLKREITTARKITHLNVIRIHDFGLAGEEGFISMEILPGGTLHERLARGPIEIKDGVDIALGIAEGLGAAHAQGVIHRDIKPHNVLFDGAGVPKLADFGLARLASATSQTMGFSGTPQYMSPELADGREITPRSDVYSTGVLFYELFAGKPPFQADSLLRLANLHSKEPPPPLRSKRPDVPPALESIIMRALEKDPARRFEDGRALAAALRDFKSGATVHLPPLPSQRRRLVPMLATVGVSAAVVAGLAYQFSTPGTVPATPTPVAAVSVSTPAPTPTPTPATPEPTRTLAPTPRKTPATPRPTPQKTAPPSPAPTSVASTQVESGFLTIRSSPWGSVWINGKLRWKDSSVVRQTPIDAGTYEIRVWNTDLNGGGSGTFTVRPGQHLFLIADPKAGTLTEKK